MTKKDKQDKQKHIQIPINAEKLKKLERKQRIKDSKKKVPAEVTLEDVFNLLVDTNERLDELEKKLKL